MENPDVFPESCALNLDILDVISANTGSIPAAADPNLNPRQDYLPGEPLIPLDHHKVHTFLAQELSTPLLDELYPRLWLAARRQGSHIEALHRQRIKGRAITPNEDPKLHLVWQPDRIYIKPIPICLLNYTIWKTFLSPAKELQSTEETRNRSRALGFLRSYAHLIKHRLDFIMAQEAHLIPPTVDWIQWSRFIVHFRALEDHVVAQRYHYGQIRLSRLQWMVRSFRPKHSHTVWFYELPHWSITSYIQGATAPLLFTFASLSVVLAAMQVLMSIDIAGLNFVGRSALQLQAASWVFSVIVLVVALVTWVLIFVIPLSALVWQVSWALKNDAKAKPGGDSIA